MTEVFMVSRGEFSDYGIEGVFSTRELAEAYITKVKAWVDAYDRASDPYDKESRYGYRSEAHIEVVELDGHDRGPLAWRAGLPAVAGAGK